MKKRHNPRTCHVYRIEVCNGALDMVHGFKFTITEFHFPHAKKPFSVNLLEEVQLHCFPCQTKERYCRESKAICVDEFLFDRKLFKAFRDMIEAKVKAEDHIADLRKLLHEQERKDQRYERPV